MKFNLLFLSFLLFFTAVNAQEQAAGDKQSGFAQYIKTVLENPTAKTTEFRKPPELTKEMLKKAEQVMKGDSAFYYLERLKPANLKTFEDQQGAFVYFKSREAWFAILALSIHWRNSVRITSVMQYKKMLTDAKEAGNNPFKCKKDKKLALRFMIALLENIPINTSGDEGAKTNNIYVSNIVGILDLMTGENITQGKSIAEWYKSETQYQADLNKWKKHL